MKPADILPLTEFDMVTSGTYLQMMKAYIPFVSLSEQRTLSLMIRIMELINTISFYKNLTAPSPLSRSCHDQQFIISEIARYCSKKDREILDMMNNMSNMSELYKMYQQMSSPDSSEAETSGKAPRSDPGFIKNMMTPQQQEMYESYMSMLNNGGNK